DAKVVEESHHLSSSLLDRVPPHTTAPAAEGAMISLPTKDEIAASLPDPRLDKKSKGLSQVWVRSASDTAHEPSRQLKRRKLRKRASEPDASALELGQTEGVDEADLTNFCVEIKNSLERDEGTYARAVSVPTPRLGKRLGAPPSVADVSAFGPSYVGTSVHASTSGCSLSLEGVVVNGYDGKSRAEVMRFWRIDFGIAARGEEIELTLFPLALDPCHMPYPYKGLSSPLYTKDEWDEPHAPESNILCKDISKDPDVCRKALDKTITPAELRRTESLLPLELSNHVNVLSDLLVSHGYELNSCYTNLVSSRAHLQEKLDQKKGDENRELCSQRDATSEEVKKLQYQLTDAKAAYVGLTEELTRIDAKLLEQALTNSLERDEGTYARAVSVPTPRLGKRLGAPPSVADVSAFGPSYVGTSVHASTSGCSLSLEGVVVNGYDGKSRAEVMRFWRIDFGIAARGEEIELTLFPLALDPCHMPYPYKGLSSPLYTKDEWDEPHAPESNILCKDISKDPDVCRKALDKTITPAELRRTESLLPLELSNHVNVLSDLLVSHGYELNSCYTNLVSSRAHLQEKLDQKKGDENRELCSQRDATSEEVKKLQYQLTDAKAAYVGLTEELTRIDAKLLEQALTEETYSRSVFVGSSVGIQLPYVYFGPQIFRIYVERGSSSEVMYEHCFRNLRSKTKAKLRESRTPLVGFSDKGKDEPLEKSLESKPPDNVVIHDDYPDQTFIIGGNLSTECRSRLIEILGKHADAFTWTSTDMIGIPYFVAEHELKTNPHIEPRVKRKQSIALDKRKVVKEEVVEWLKAGIVRNVQETYQRLVNTIFKGQIGRNLEAYVDDMVIESKTEPEMIKDVEETLLTLKKAMKKLIAKLPTLTGPKKEEEPMVYLSAANEAVSAILLVKREGRQAPIHYVSRTLQGAEINYLSMEKLALGLVHAA
nr:reverse transcriptase domain-containing protein [Tanacetum cinerariifolium]